MSTAVAAVLEFWTAMENREDVGHLLAEDIEVRDFDLPDAGVYTGHEGFARWLEDWSEAWEDWDGHLDDLLDLGDEVVSRIHVRARARSGMTVARDDSQLVTVRDGKIARVEYFGAAATATERAGDAARAADRSAVHEKLRALYAAAAREDVEGVVAQLHPDYEFHPEAGTPMGASYRGHAGARRYFEELFEALDVLALEVERLVDSGDRVVALFELRNRGRGSGIELAGRWGELWETAGTDIVGSRFYQSHDEPLADAGLR